MSDENQRDPEEKQHGSIENIDQDGSELPEISR